MNKQNLVAAFVAQLEQDLMVMKAAALAAFEAATNEESKPENEYDTRGLEASYLAGAQAKRAAEIDEVLSLFKNLTFPNLGDGAAIQSTALVSLKIGTRNTRLLLLPKGGGVRVNFEGQPVQIVTPSSALGQSLLGLKVGDIAEFESGGGVNECEVLSIQ